VKPVGQAGKPSPTHKPVVFKNLVEIRRTALNGYALYQRKKTCGQADDGFFTDPDPNTPSKDCWTNGKIIKVDMNGDGNFEKTFPIENGRVIFPDEAPKVPVIISQPKILYGNQLLFSGIVKEKTQLNALINDEVYVKGNTIKNYLIRDINEKEVLLTAKNNPNKQIVLPLGTVITLENH
jgi:hypothetical protein